MIKMVETISKWSLKRCMERLHKQHYVLAQFKHPSLLGVRVEGETYLEEINDIDKIVDIIYNELKKE